MAHMSDRISIGMAHKVAKGGGHPGRGHMYGDMYGRPYHPPGGTASAAAMRIPPGKLMLGQGPFRVASRPEQFATAMTSSGEQVPLLSQADPGIFGLGQEEYELLGEEGTFGAEKEDPGIFGGGPGLFGAEEGIF